MYDHKAVIRQVDCLLSEKPRIKLTEIARQLRVGRHTILRALTSQGLEFRLMRTQRTDELISKLLLSFPLLTIKEMAFSVGFPSASSFSHYLRRRRSSLSGSRNCRESTPVLSTNRERAKGGLRSARMPSEPQSSASTGRGFQRECAVDTVPPRGPTRPVSAKLTDAAAARLLR